jgi:hypothetical protein
MDAENAVMIQHAAELEVQFKRAAVQAARKQREAHELKILRQHHQYGLTMLIIATFMILTCVGACTALEWRKAPSNTEDEAPAIPSIATDNRAVREIPRTLDLIQDVDVNGDGKNNCIDYVIQFWMYYPVKKDVRIIWNKHPSNGLNHLYVEVGTFKVETGAWFWSTNRKHTMWELDEFWAAQYFSTYDKDVTANLPAIMANTYGW